MPCSHIIKAFDLDPAAIFNVRRSTVFATVGVERRPPPFVAHETGWIKALQLSSNDLKTSTLTDIL
jgi:hypothetical protein